MATEAVHAEQWPNGCPTCKRAFGASLDVERLAEAVAVVDLGIPPDDHAQRLSWRQTEGQVEQARAIAAEYERLARA